jgi:hypothetical protein
VSDLGASPKTPGFFEEWTLAFNDFENMLIHQESGVCKSSRLKRYIRYIAHPQLIRGCGFINVWKQIRGVAKAMATVGSIFD